MKVLLVGVDVNELADVTTLTLPFLIAYCQARPELQPQPAFEMLRLSTEHSPLYISNRIIAAQPDLLGLSLQVWSEEVLRRVIRRVGAVLPHTTIVVGGHQVTSRAELLMSELPEIDVTVTGEGEQPFVELLYRLVRNEPLTEVAGTTWRQPDGTIVTATETPPPLAIATLDDLPSPYLGGAAGEPATKAAYIETARNCPFSCAYCDFGRGSRQVRFRDLSVVEQELSWLRARGVSSLTFLDPVFNWDRGRAGTILDIAERLGFESVSVQIRVELLEEPLVQRLSRFNAILGIGIQSIDPEVCRLMGRKLDLDRARRSIALLQAHEVKFKVHLICGLPGDTYDSFCASIDEVLGWNPVAFEAFPLQILPGTPYHMAAERLGLQYDIEPPHEVLQTTTMPYADLIEARALGMIIQKLHGHQYFREPVMRCARLGVPPSTIYGELAYRSVAEGVLSLDELLGRPIGIDQEQASGLVDLLHAVISEQGIDSAADGPGIETRADANPPA